MTFFPSHSYEQYYQAVRRCWRFGQTRPVIVDVVTTEGEAGRARRTCSARPTQATEMFAPLVEHMKRRARARRESSISDADGGAGMAVLTAKEQYVTDVRALQRRLLEVMPTLPDDSIHLSIYSPPFGGLYHYSSSERDLSNCRSRDEFFEHYAFVVRELAPRDDAGPMTAVHCMDVPSRTTAGDCYDFPGDIIRLHEQRRVGLHRPLRRLERTARASATAR